jgi:predicted CopG family antitoxin
MAKQKKPRKEHYEKPIKLKEGTQFLDVINALVKGKKKPETDKK